VFLVVKEKAGYKLLLGFKKLACEFKLILSQLLTFEFLLLLGLKLLLILEIFSVLIGEKFKLLHSEGVLK